jgi:hypothetical protein
VQPLSCSQHLGDNSSFKRVVFFLTSRSFVSFRSPSFAGYYLELGSFCRVISSWRTSTRSLSRYAQPSLIFVIRKLNSI